MSTKTNDSIDFGSTKKVCKKAFTVSLKHYRCACVFRSTVCELESFTSLRHCVFSLDVLRYSSLLAVVAVKVQLYKHRNELGVDALLNKDFVGRIEKIRNM